MIGEYDPLDPYGVNQPTPEPPPLPPQPAARTPDAGVTGWFRDWMAQNGITSANGTPEDAEALYSQFLAQNNGDPDQTRQQTLRYLGWNAKAPATTTTTNQDTNRAPFDFGNSSPTGNLIAPFTETWTPPTPQALPEVPRFQAPTFKQAPAFSFADFQSPGPFKAPTIEEATADPGWQFRQGQANQAFMNNRAASGTAHTGGTIKDFLDYNQNAASQEYNNVWNRNYGAYQSNFQNALSSYAANRGNALSNYNTNYQTQYVDPFNMADLAAQQEFAPQLLGYQTNAANTQHQNDLNNANSWNAYLNRFDIFKDQRDSTFDKQYKIASF